MSTTLTAGRPQTTVPVPGPRLLRLGLIVDALTFYTAAAMNFGAHIPLGFITLQFPFRVIPAGVGEAVIGTALLLGGLSLRRGWAWIGLWLSAGGIAFGLAVGRSRAAILDVHLVMLALALSILGLLLWTAQAAPGWSRQDPRKMAKLTSGAKATAGLMLLAGVTLLGASAIHFSLTAPAIVDPFTAAATPEAVLGGIMIVGAACLLSARSGTWEFSVAATVLTILLTIYGFTTTLRTGRIGDLSYHLTLLAMLFTSLVLLLSPVGRRARG